MIRGDQPVGVELSDTARLMRIRSDEATSASRAGPSSDAPAPAPCARGRGRCQGSQTSRPCSRRRRWTLERLKSIRRYGWPRSGPTATTPASSPTTSCAPPAPAATMRPMHLVDFSLALGGGGREGRPYRGGTGSCRARPGPRPDRWNLDGLGDRCRDGSRLSAERMTAIAARIDPWRVARRPARLAMFDQRPLIERVVAEVGHPLIEDLPIPYAAATYDLVTGRHELVTRGPVVDALMRSCAISVVFPPIVDGDAILVDAGVWEPVPISLARRWAPDRPVVGVQVISPKPAWFASPPLTWSLHAGARLLGIAPNGNRLNARRYSALLATRITEPWSMPGLTSSSSRSWATSAGSVSARWRSRVTAGTRPPCARWTRLRSRASGHRHGGGTTRPDHGRPAADPCPPRRRGDGHRRNHCPLRTEGRRVDLVVCTAARKGRSTIRTSTRSRPSRA